MKRREKNAKINFFIFWTWCNADNRTVLSNTVLFTKRGRDVIGNC